jgi:hypothetical protein
MNTEKSPPRNRARQAPTRRLETSGSPGLIGHRPSDGVRYVSTRCFSSKATTSRYSDSPAASRAFSRLEKISSRTALPSRIFQTCAPWTSTSTPLPLPRPV